MTNVDAQEVHSSNHLNNLFLQTYIGNMLETFNSKYTTEELDKARDAYKLYLDNLPEPVAVPDANASTEGMPATAAYAPTNMNLSPQYYPVDAYAGFANMLAGN